MPIQTGNMPIRGTMNNMTYFKSQDGVMVKMKSAISKEKFKTPAFERTRRNQAEFGLAGKAGATLRNAISSLLLNVKDGRLASRLTTLMLQIARTDTTSVHGERNVDDGQLELLAGFEFNANASLNQVFNAPYTLDIDRPTGKISMDIPGFDPSAVLKFPEGTTHFKLVSGGCEINFGSGTYITESYESPELAVDAETAPVNIVHSLTANSDKPLLLVFGVKFFQQVNGVSYPLLGKSTNALSILKAEKA